MPRSLPIPLNLPPAPPPKKQGFGFTQDNVLGMSLQDNSWKADFATFMVENRLLPQFERAQDKFGEKYGTNNEDALAFRSMGGRVFDRAKEVLAELEGAKPCLLHGGEGERLVHTHGIGRGVR